jgi:hypothetical protein
MKCTFYRPQEIDISEFSSIVKKLSLDLHKLEKGMAEKRETITYVKELCKHAKPLEHNLEMFFWGLASPCSMPRDARVEFLYLPTYLATSFLIKAILLYPELIDESDSNERTSDIELSNLRNVLRLAMNGCMGRNFDGAGVLPLKKCVRIFERAGTVEFLEKYPNICPEFGELFTQKKAMVDRGERPMREVLWY